MDAQEAIEILWYPGNPEKKNKLLRGLLILLPYYRNLDQNIYIDGEYMNVVGFKECVALMDKEEVEELSELSWYADEDTNHWFIDIELLS